MRTVLLLGGLLSVLAACALTLSSLTHGLSAKQAVIVPLFGAAAALGLLVLRRQPRNAVGWLWISVVLLAIFYACAQNYALLRYRDHYRGLPFGPAAVFVDDTFWALFFVLLPLVILLFPDGRLPSRRWRWPLRVYLGLCVLVMVGQFAGAAGGVSGRPIRVDSAGQNMNSWNSDAIGSRLADILIWLAPLIGLLMLSFVVAQVLAWRRASGDRRQQLKWLMAGSTVSVVSLAVTFSSAQTASIPHAVVAVLGIGVLALPVSIAIGILKYRLYDIDRLISRTISYTLLTGLLVGIFAGIVLLTPCSALLLTRGRRRLDTGGRRTLQPSAPTPATRRRPPLQPRPLRRRSDDHRLHEPAAECRRPRQHQSSVGRGREYGRRTSSHFALDPRHDSAERQTALAALVSVSPELWPSRASARLRVEIGASLLGHDQ